MITLPKSRLNISSTAKMALGTDFKRTIISTEYCPRTPEHKTCKLQISVGSMFAACPKENYKKYQLRCKNCREELATVYSKDKTLRDWRRISYKSWHGRDMWYGLRGLNIHPETNNLTLECCCEPEVRKTPDEFMIKEIN